MSWQVKVTRKERSLVLATEGWKSSKTELTGEKVTRKAEGFIS